jgi:hypothetical protein
MGCEELLLKIREIEKAFSDLEHYEFLDCCDNAGAARIIRCASLLIQEAIERLVE